MWRPTANGAELTLSNSLPQATDHDSLLLIAESPTTATKTRKLAKGPHSATASKRTAEEPTDCELGQAGQMQRQRRLAKRAHTDRLQTVGQMVSGLAHEINAPLAAARNYAQACVNFARAGRLAPGDELLQLMEKVATQADRACEIVNRLSRFVKCSDGFASNLDINQLIREVMAWMGPNTCSQSAKQEPIEMQLELASGLPTVIAVRVQVEQVLVNLIRNAVDALDDRPEKPRRLTLSTVDCRTYVRIGVTDTGCGMRQEQISQLFHSFASTKISGLGLGLSIARSIVKAHGGTIWAESTFGRGTTFYFTLPTATCGAKHADGTDGLDN